MLQAFPKAGDPPATADEPPGHAAAAPPPRPEDHARLLRQIWFDAAHPEPHRQRRDGGWRGGARRIRGALRGVAFAAGVDAHGEAWLSVDGILLAPISVTFAPWGFRMTVGDLVAGVSYAAGLRPPEGPPRLSILPYGPGWLEFGTRIRVLCEPFDPRNPET